MLNFISTSLPVLLSIKWIRVWRRKEKTLRKSSDRTYTLPLFPRFIIWAEKATFFFFYFAPGEIHEQNAARKTAVTPYIFIRAELHAARPVDSPHVGSGHLEDVQLERLLDEDDVIVCEANAVAVARCEKRPAGNSGNRLHILQSRNSLAFV